MLFRGKLLLKNCKYSINNLKFINKFSFRYFSSGSNHNNHEDTRVHGDGANGHDDHGHHHEITGEVDLNKVYVPISSQMKPFVSLTGLNQSHEAAHSIIEGEYKARNAITPISIPLITRSRVYFKDLASVSYEENNYFHPEPYGYLISDDPWDPNPQTWQPILLVFLGFCGILFMTSILRLSNQSNKKIVIEEMYHAHYTANLIEDEIRKIRKLDYPYRKMYDQMKNGNTSTDE